MVSDYAPVIAVATARIITGVLFFFQGYDKVFSVGLPRIKETMRVGTASWRLPFSFIGVVAMYTSYVELIAGFLLILGLLKYIAIYLLCLDLLIVSVGFSMAKPMWETGHVFIRLSLLILLLLLPPAWDLFSIDHLLQLAGINI
jgi:uncharacterized membrane protein YphA (DoxX/SURF4 family)